MNKYYRRFSYITYQHRWGYLCGRAGELDVTRIMLYDDDNFPLKINEYQFFEKCGSTYDGKPYGQTINERLENFPEI
jgi:hypothetical protein